VRFLVLGSILAVLGLVVLPAIRPVPTVVEDEAAYDSVAAGVALQRGVTNSFHGAAAVKAAGSPADEGEDGAGLPAPVPTEAMRAPAGTVRRVGTPESSSWERDWVRLYRLAVMPDTEKQLSTANFYNWRKMAALGNVTATCGGRYPKLGLRYFKSPLQHSVAQVFGGCVTFDASKVTFERRGGENLADVEGQPEAVEYPTLADGWLVARPTAEEGPCSGGAVSTGLSPQQAALPDHLGPTVSGVRLALSVPCEPAAEDAAVEPLVLLVRRYEYVNLYHTLTDWFNAMDAIQFAVAALGLGFPTGPVQVVFLDAHPAGSLDDVWTALFGKRPLYLAEAIDRGLRTTNAVFVSPGYRSPITSAMQAGQMGETRSLSVQLFAEWMLLRHNLSLLSDVEAHRVAAAAVRLERGLQAPSALAFLNALGEGGGADVLPRRWITVVFRGDYKPHPRSAGRTSRKIANEQKLLTAIDAALATSAQLPGEPWAVRGVHLESLSMREQLALFRSTTIMVSVHGAALSLVITMRPGTLLVELQPPAFVRPHFRPMALSAGIGYAVVPLEHAPGDGPYTVDTAKLAAVVTSHVPRLL